MGDATGRRRTFGYGAITLCGREFNPVRLERRFITPAGPVGARTRDPATPHAQPPTGITRTRFGLIRFRSPLLTEYPFLQVLRCFTSLRTPRPKAVPPHDGWWVPPFGNPRIKALLAAPRGLSQPHTSFIGTVCQGIHHTPFTGNHTAARDKASKHRTTDLRTNDHKTIRTKNKTSTRRSSSEKTVNKKRIFLARVHSPVLKPPPRPEPEPANPTRGTDGTRYGEPMPDPKARWRSGNPKACPYHTRATDLFHTSSPTDAGPSGRGATPGANRALNLRRKEVIQPHLPVRLPCYDLVPITSLTLDGSPHKG